MATSHADRSKTRSHRPQRGTLMSAGEAESTTTIAGAGVFARIRPAELSLAGLRVGLGFVFLWAFLDKTFGFGYATANGKGWVDGGSPTKGFLSHVHVGPMASTLRGWAGAGWADWMFMLGLLAVGTALVLGIGMRLAAVAGTAMMGLMWLAEWPPAKHLDSGAPSASTNPFVDYHLIYALALIALAAFAIRSRLGLGSRWARITIVDRNRRLL
ncbi:hypothetical protein ACWGR4_22190 [Embleya sp. NPDC055664]